MIDGIVATKRQEVRELRKGRPGPRRKKPVIPLVFDGPVNIIAEVKRKSPSAGFIAEIDSKRIDIYSKYAKAISVLADRTYFGGSPELLEEVAGQSPLPVLFKDFVIDPVQIDLAYAVGADIVLLIVRILSEGQLAALYSHARALGLACLVEVHEREELPRIAEIGAEMVGVNTRNLDTLRMDLPGAADILKDLTAPIRVAESGIKSRSDIERLTANGANGFLIGEMLMRAEELEATFQGLIYG